jgi:hypothetical protein
VMVESLYYYFIVLCSLWFKVFNILYGIEWFIRL